MEMASIIALPICDMRRDLRNLGAAVSGAKLREVARGQPVFALRIRPPRVIALPTPGARVPCAARPRIRTMATSSTTGQPDDDQVFEPGLVHKKSRALERGRGA